MKSKVMWTVGLVFCALTTMTAMAQPSNPVLAAVKITEGLSAEAYSQRAEQLMAEADQFYAVDFFDHSRWQEALAYAYAAFRAAPDNPAYIRSLAKGYTKTQYWIQGYQLWKELESAGTLSAQELDWAALCAAKVGYLRLTDGSPQEAAAFLADSLRWKESAEVRAMLERVQITMGNL